MKHNLTAQAKNPGITTGLNYMFVHYIAAQYTYQESLLRNIMTLEIKHTTTVNLEITSKVNKWRENWRRRKAEG